MGVGLVLDGAAVPHAPAAPSAAVGVELVDSMRAADSIGNSASVAQMLIAGSTPPRSAPPPNCRPH